MIIGTSLPMIIGISLLVIIGTLVPVIIANDYQDIGADGLG